MNHNRSNHHYLSLTLIILLLSSALYAQETPENVPKATKMDAFISTTGVIRKFVDFHLSGMKGAYLDIAETRIRQVSLGNATSFFYQIEKKTKYGSTIASIEYTDIKEVIKAITTLKSEVNSDLAVNPDYLENKFVTVDGFQVGYYVSKGKASWYLNLERRGSDAVIIINNVETIESAFTEAQKMIESLIK